MDPKRHERLAALFLQACALPSEEREEFLATTCAQDPDLRREVEALLIKDRKAGREATQKLGSPIGAVAGQMAREGAEPADSIPVRIAHFRIASRLGAGGAGTVFEALDERMNRRVALKVMSSALTLSSRAALRFEREAWIAGRLSHPNIVRVFERGTWEGYRYYSMELIEGGSLQEVIENMRRSGSDTRLGLDFGSAEYVHWAVRQVLLAARALHHAHQQGIIHRDVKPPNLLLDGDPPQVKLADFGIAMDEERTRLTTEGSMIGTVCYMAPEQLLGQKDDIDGRTDVHALGVTLFELLTLEYPYRGETHQRYVNAVLVGEARRPREINGRVSRDLEVVIRKTLEKDRRHRYGSAEEFASDLENVLQLRPIRARSPGPAERLAKWVRRKPLHATLIGILAVGMPTVGLLGYRATRQARQLLEARVETLESVVDQLAMSDQVESMVRIAAEILELEPANATALRSLAVGNANLADAATDNEQAETLRGRALAFLDRLISAQPGIAGHQRLKADFLRRWGRGGDAEELERRAAAMPEPTDEDGLFYAALDAVERHDLTGAEERLSQVIVRRPRPEALLWRAVVRQRQGHDADAIEDYQSAVAARPMNSYPHRELGRIYTRQGRFADARLQLERALTLAPEDPLAHEVFADYALEHGRRLRAQGDPNMALVRFREAEEHAARSLAIDAARPFSHLNMGVSIVEQARTTGVRDREELDRALEHFARARDLAGSGTDRSKMSEAAGKATADSCDALIEYREAERAVSSCREVVVLQPKDATAHYNLAGAYALAGLETEALAELERDVDLGDHDHAYLLSDAWFASMRGAPRFRRLIERMKEAASAESAGPGGTSPGPGR